MFCGLRHAAELGDCEEDFELAQFEPSTDLICPAHSAPIQKKYTDSEK
jgi:hypothetical protein